MNRSAARQEKADRRCGPALRIRFARQARGLTLRFFNLHADDLGAVEAVDVLDVAVEDDFAIEVADYLVNVHDDSAVGEGFETLGLDDGVNHVPLARPVFAHGLVAADATAFHAVGPIHIRMQEEQKEVEIALVECIVDGLE
jgi:hypothetical protein